MSSPPAIAMVSPEKGVLAQLWQRLAARLRPVPIASVDQLKTYIEERAALIAQKCATDYCRGKTGLASYALFSERPFLEAFEVCRWETYVVVLGDLLLVAEGQLRAQLPSAQHARLCEALVALYSDSISALPVPVHRTHGWSDIVASVAARARAASGESPRQALDVADHSARRLFETLPIHTRYRELDEEVVYGAVRFRMIAVSQEMQRRLAAPELAGRLIA